MGLEHSLEYISIKANKSNYEEAIPSNWFCKSPQIHLLLNLTITKVKNAQEEILMRETTNYSVIWIWSDCEKGNNPTVKKH